ncbi:iron-sulfur cluster co-chaperone protein HscB-like protein, mitochondrial [Choristoneura fumiferana]|uniref:iron-sulfur cluster co-chaperone protein HscB-like protein, mitochondrial n=1 Tax=Choristoneura fumiferana TaxID=7141 RepID=UPI003D15D38B
MNILRLLPYNRGIILSHIRYSSCWSCGQNIKILVENLFCSNCKSLQKPSKDNYFKVLGVSETFDLDENDLARRFKELQKYLHPDKYANKPKEEQEISEKYSSLVNESYKTLLHPLTRGIYMLHIRGKDIPEDTEVKDQAFLMMIMEKNEEVENAETAEEIMILNKENKELINKLQKEVSQAFYDGDLQLVIKLLSKMKYYTSIDQQIQNLIRSKGIIR